MCTTCVDVARSLFPDCPDERLGDFLMSATCFPFGDGEIVARQLREHREAGCATWLDAVDRAEAQIHKAMAAWKEANPRDAAEEGR